MPRHSYGLGFIYDRVLASADGVPLRSRDFYEDHGIVSVSDGDLSWSDLLDVEPLNPSYQLFHQWGQKFALKAQVWLRALLLACILSGCDLKSRLGKSLEAFDRCPKDLHPLLLAAGLVGLLQQQPVRSCLRETLILVYGSNPGSHKLLRASGPQLLQYGEELKFTDFGHT
jgi:hypothetical protein